MTEEEFLQISSYMKQYYGIDFKNKKDAVKGKLENFIKNQGWHSCTDFMKAMENDPSGNQETMLVNFLTINYTFFMREFEHFEYLKHVVLPWIVKKEALSRDIRIWCGAASTGEEPYMLAMVIMDFLGLDRRKWDFRVLATDVSTKALRQAMSGIYKAEGICDMPKQWKQRFFAPVAGGSQYAVKAQLKNEVIFRKFNLMDPFPFKRKMHAVFLRNVMIYFDQETKQELVRKVYDCLEPGGYLFIGLTETLDGEEALFDNVQPSVFKKK